MKQERFINQQQMYSNRTLIIIFLKLKENETLRRRQSRGEVSRSAHVCEGLECGHEECSERESSIAADAARTRARRRSGNSARGQEQRADLDESGHEERHERAELCARERREALGAHAVGAGVSSRVRGSRSGDLRIGAVAVGC